MESGRSTRCTSRPSDWSGTATPGISSYIAWRTVSQDGRFVAFISEGYLSGESNGTDIFVRDTCIGAPAGCTPSTSWASNDPDGINPATDKEYVWPSISADGHYVAFTSPSVANGGQVFLTKTGY